LKSEPIAHFDPNVFLTTPGPGHRITKYRSDEVIFAQGDPAKDIFYIQAGQVKITVVSRRGKEAVIGILSTDHFFGEGALNGQGVRISSATTIEDCTIARLSIKSMVRILHVEAHYRLT